MKSLFDNQCAFAPFYDDLVSVEGRRGSRTVQTGALPACVLDEGLDDTLQDGSTSTTRRRYSISIRVADWPDTEPPREGYSVLLADGTRLSVMSVSRPLGDYQLEARTC